MSLKINKLVRKHKNRRSLYLDYVFEGKRIQEYTNLFYLVGNDNITKAHNKNVDILFEKRKAEKFQQLFEGSNNYIPSERRKADFFKYVKNYQEENPTEDRKLKSCLKHLHFYCKGSLIFSEIDNSFINGFKKHLEQRLKGETPKGYFKAFNRILIKATKEKYLLENPASEIRITVNKTEEKEVLSLDEIEILKAYPCSNRIVKKAFLFACYTGLRFCDIEKLKWSNIHHKDGILILDFIQSKTKKKLSIPLNQSASAQLPVKGNTEQIFVLPSANGTNKLLKTWVKNAGIDKSITRHCGRHSFGTNINSLTNDIYTTSKLMGHSSLNMTLLYARPIDEKLLAASTAIDKAILKH